MTKAIYLLTLKEDKPMGVTLSQLIDQVREELLSPRQARTPEAMYPFLFVDEVELEINVTASSTLEGAGKVNIQVVELGSGVEKASEQIHRVRIKMTPLMTKEEVREKLRANERVWQRIENVVMPATTKDGGMVGSE
jgi:hypothetical protein